MAKKKIDVTRQDELIDVAFVTIGEQAVCEE